MSTSEVPWPRQLSQQTWPAEGVQFSYEHRGYVKPVRLGLWLEKAFGKDIARYQVSLHYPKSAMWCVFDGIKLIRRLQLFNQRLYVKAPRKPTNVSPDDLEYCNCE